MKACKNRRLNDKVDPYICPTRAEALELLNAADHRKQIGNKTAIKDWLYVRLDLNTGLRRSEVCELRCKHVLLNRAEIHVAFGKTPESRRVIPLNDEILEDLIAYQIFKTQWGEGWQPDEPLFRSPVNHSQYDGSTLYRSFQRVLDLAKNIEHPQRFRPHSMRHAFATCLYENTLDMKLVSELLGHTSIATTARVYVHLFDRQKRKIAVQNLYGQQRPTKKTAVRNMYRFR